MADKQVVVPYRIFNHVFMKIAEPRIVRIIFFGMYLFFIFCGVGIWLEALGTQEFRSVLSTWLVRLFGGFFVLGGIFCAFAVLPGIWWLERAGILALTAGVLMYLLIIIGLEASMVGIGFSMILFLLFLLRWLDIKEFQLAPKEG